MLSMLQQELASVISKQLGNVHSAGHEYEYHDARFCGSGCKQNYRTEACVEKTLTSEMLVGSNRRILDWHHRVRRRLRCCCCYIQ